MALTPQITLTANLLDYSGNQIGSASAPAWLRIALCGFGQTLPCIPGTGMMAQIASWPKDIPYTGSQITVMLFGNDVILPSGQTYYSISVLDSNRNVIQSGIYQFSGTATIDLSTATQLNIQPVVPTPVPTGVYFADEIVPTGTINSTDGITGNGTFTLPNAPSPAGSLNLFKNGQRLTRGVAFSLSGATINYASGYLPITGADSHVCFYRYTV